MKRRPSRLKEGERLFRNIGFAREAIDEAARTIEIAFSSEEPVERWFGTEILDHSSGAVRLDFLNDGAPLLLDHSTGKQIGVVVRAWVDADRVARAVVRFSKGALAEEIWQDVLDEIRSKISVGYDVHEWNIKQEPGQLEESRAIDWEPLEISFVAIPADRTVGVGRGEDRHRAHMDPEDTTDQNRTDNNGNRQNEPAPDDRRAPEKLTAERRAQIENEARDQELARIRGIEELGNQFDKREMASEFIAAGKSLDEFRAELLTKLQTPVPTNAADLGMDRREVERFSFLRAINHLVEPGNARLRDAAAFEIECSEEARKKAGKDSGAGITIPWDVLRDKKCGIPVGDAMSNPLLAAVAMGRGHAQRVPYINSNWGQRDLTTTGASAVIGTEILSASFIDLLRNASMLLPRATQLFGLTDNVAIPRHTTAATAYWVNEGSGPTESTQAFDQVTASPTTVGGFVDYSRRFLLQSSIDVDGFVQADLARIIGIELDRVGIEGSGSGAEPEGIINVTGIGDVAGGANGSAPTWDDVVDIRTEIAKDNALIGSIAWLLNSVTVGKLMKTKKDTGSGIFVLDDDMRLGGYDVLESNNVPGDLTKGTGTNLSAMVLGNLIDLVYFFWSGIDINIDTSTHSTSGTVRVVALQDTQVKPRHPQSFAAKKDADNS